MGVNVHRDPEIRMSRPALQGLRGRAVPGSPEAVGVNRCERMPHPLLHGAESALSPDTGTHNSRTVAESLFPARLAGVGIFEEHNILSDS